MRLKSVVAHVFVGDMSRAVAFYTEQLGFTVAFLYGDPPYYGQIVRDGVGLAIRHVDAPPMDPALVRREELLSGYFEVEDIDALNAEFLARNVPFEQQLALQPWGQRRFIVRDPDGNLVMFNGP